MHKADLRNVHFKPDKMLKAQLSLVHLKRNAIFHQMDGNSPMMKKLSE